ncbi:MAG: UvrD-helicase domain-containing protein [Aeromicrobium sp.]|uniref:UvrD-helicase domain-containing protein n=1 Tax=Aeromicrobium sp. TaxID=1871063 RepID=UPI0039E29183
MSTTSEFHITDPLPTGTLLIEASAGTGKTWTIAALVTRLVAEGRAGLDELLIVTFGRAASTELRDRVRDRLREAAAHLDADAPATDDPLLTLLGETDREARRDRLRAALVRFDEATITTTHGFCHTVLRGLGVLGDVEPGSALVEDDLALVHDVAADLYLRAVGSGATPPFSPAQARELAGKAVEDAASRLLPDSAEPGSEADRRRRFAEAVRTEAARRRLAARSLSYDDLLARLADALEDDDSPAREVMRSRWRVVLVDEFQDTDPVQWRILERAFVGHATLVLVGDPKQAIYAFRGGDVATYLHAARTADERRTLRLNHRSDAPLVAAVDAVQRGAALGDPDIVVHPAEAARQGSRLVDPDHGHPFRLRLLTRDDANTPPGKGVPVGVARAKIADDVAADIARLVSGDATYDPGDGPRPVQPGDVAVLVESHAHGALVREALAKLDIPAVSGGGLDVLHGPAGAHWLTLLAAAHTPHRSGLVRAAALGPFFGVRAEALADETSGDALTDQIASRLRDLADVERTHGLNALTEALLGGDVTARLLAEGGGRRLVTDLEHVGQVLAQAARDTSLSLVGVIDWLTEHRRAGAPPTDRLRRLDSDADAVQIATIFVSKGLQYPVVYAPFLFDRYTREREILRLHDDEGRRCLDVGGPHPARREHVERDAAERAGESLRLLYVAMTRAQSQLVLHWAPTFNGKHAALTRLLFRPDPDSPGVPDVLPPPSDLDAVARLRAWSERGGPALERMQTPRARPLSPATVDVELSARSFTRELDTAWTRTSYSSLIRREDDAPVAVAVEPEEPDTDDESEVVVEDAPESDLGPSPWAELFGGADLGTLVHGVLEDVDSEADDLDAEVRGHVEERLSRRPLPVDPDVLTSALVGALTTPLGPLADDLTLAEALALRPFREMDFELPLAGGWRPHGPGGTLSDIADLMEEHLPEGDPLRPFAPDLRDPDLGWRSLRGYLNGSIDLLLRLPGDRALVVDHKTNRLEGPGGGLEAYAPDRLAEAMTHTTYPLQALLYTVAQHRFLRWRLRGYDPDTHLAGVLYLFVRGMTGPDVPRAADGAPYGVFAWRPPTALVLGLSDLLDGSAGRTP